MLRWCRRRSGDCFLDAGVHSSIQISIDGLRLMRELTAASSPFNPSSLLNQTNLFLCNDFRGHFHLGFPEHIEVSIYCSETHKDRKSGTWGL